MERHEPADLTCRELRRVLLARSRSDLPPKTRVAVEAHLNHCPRCRQRWEHDSDSRRFYRLFRLLRTRSSIKDAVMDRLDLRAGDRRLKK